MFHPTQTPRYPYLYSERVIEDFVEKYSRATCFVAKKLGMAPKRFKWLLVKQFRTSNNRWNVTRDVIKWIDRSNGYAYFRDVNRVNFIKYLTSVTTLVQDEVIFEQKTYSAIDADDFSNDDSFVG